MTAFIHIMGGWNYEFGGAKGQQSVGTVIQNLLEVRLGGTIEQQQTTDTVVYYL